MMRAPRPTTPPLAELACALNDAAPGRASTREIDVRALSHDASHYVLTPRAIVRPSNGAELAAVMAAASRAGSTVTFRSGGTSLSGQAGTNGVLVDTRLAFRRIEVADNGALVTAQPGATLRAVNARLARHRRRLGPDPASEIACTIGGVVANNSSGMACGTEQNTYATLHGMTAVLASGTVIDTRSPTADAHLAATEPEIYAGLGELRDRLRADAESSATVRRLFAMKNTMGYSINALLDYDEPVQILEHLVVGSEGTLAFVADATFRTVPVSPRAATALIVYPDLEKAAAAVPALVASGCSTVELLDAASLRVARDDATAGATLTEFEILDHAALLAELRAEDDDALAALVDAASAILSASGVVGTPRFTTDDAAREALWRVRKGLYASVAGGRAPGTTALLEDVCVPVDRLAQTCAGLTALFARYDYAGAVIFGHAKDGNLHFLVTERFDTDAGVNRYRQFTEDMVDLVIEQGGTLKAEHGTGRVMAPFVERQYGATLTTLMWDIKNLFDPAHILNPGVVLTTDNSAHLRHLKPAGTVGKVADRCVECGYCEPVCPSADLTLSPRTRIAILREVDAARRAGDARLARRLEHGFEYAGVDTCAVDGMCQTACPVGINTGDIVKEARATRAGRPTRALWRLAARRWAAVTSAASAALTATSHVPQILPRAATSAVRAAVGAERMPQWEPHVPRGGAARLALDPLADGDPAPDAVLFPSCLSRIYSSPVGDESDAAAVVALAHAEGLTMVTPDGVAALCCGAPWSSKGLSDGGADMAARVVDRLAGTATGTPVVVDSSSCAESLAATLAADSRTSTLVVLDASTWIARTVLPLLEPRPDADRVGRVVVHPTCASARLGSSTDAVTVASAYAKEVVVPHDWRCCAMAGDRGLLQPELTASATSREAAEVAQIEADAYVTSNRACAVAMRRATGQDYIHVASLAAASIASTSRDHR